MLRYGSFGMAGACAALLLCGGSASGQSTADSEASAATEGKLETLVITAQRRATDLQDTAVAASVLTGEDLIDKGVYGLTALQYAVPSVTISDLASANVFNIRGIGKSQVDVDLPSGVVIYRDGAPTIANYFQNEPYFDMGSIEVLRGPQGTYNGQGAAGGSVYIRTRDPELGKMNGSVQIGGGNFSQAEFTGVLNLPVGDTVAVRMGFNHFQRDDYYDDISGIYSGNPGERKLDTFRLGVLWQPNDQTDVVFKSDFSDLDFGGNPTSSYQTSLFDVVNQDANFKYTDKSARGVLKVSTHTDKGVTFVSLTGAQHLETINNLDANASQPGFAIFNSRGDINIYSQEFDWISPEDLAIRWVLGAFAFQQQVDIPSWEDHGFTFNGFFGGTNIAYPVLASPWDQQQTNYAVFAHVAYSLTSSIEVEGGIRYGLYDLRQSTEWVLGFGVDPPAIPLTPPGAEEQNLSERDLDGTIGVNWTLSHDHFLYALVSLGHVNGGVNLFPAAGPQPFFDYNPMEVVNYEAGWKATWFDGNLRTQFDGYYERFDNYQANFGQDIPGGVGNFSNIAVFRNADGNSDVWGAEFSAQAVFGNLSFNVDAAYSDSELGTFENVIDPFLPPPPPAGSNVVDLSGAKSPFTPKWTGNVGVAYAIHLPADMTLTPRVDYAYIDDCQAGLWDSPQITLESRNLTNAQVRLETARWWADLWVTNATDEKYAGGIQNNGALFYAAPPRMYGLRAGMSF